MFAEILFPATGKSEKVYLEEETLPGVRVLSPGKTRPRIGLVLRELPPESDLFPRKTGVSVLDKVPVISPDLLSFLQWVSWYYQSSLAQVIRTALPRELLHPPRPRVCLSAEGREILPVSIPLVARLRRAGRRGLTLETIQRSYGPGALKMVREWLKKGLLKEACPLSQKGRPLSIISPEILDQTRTITPTTAQKAAAAVISQSLSGDFHPFLLHGVTGSGKTWVYIKAVSEVLKRGKSALILVPEIALIGALEGAFVAEFGQEVALFHSFLSERQRTETWLKACRGKCRIVIGARSAIFVPLKDLGLIVVDEEHDPSYKQEEGLRYQARDLALARGQMAGATVILGSATPSIKSYYLARKGRLRLISLRQRASGQRLPQTRIVDLTQVERPGYLLSRPLLEALKERLRGGEQAIVFVNRRGFATLVVCHRCGYQFRCLNCSVALTYHKEEGELRCHYCGLTLKALPQCPACGQGRLEILGLGTQRVAEELARLLPEARIGRLDRDVARSPGRLKKVLDDFQQGELNILVGTQMLSKGHHFPRVTLVGVILADLSLNFPDFRAPERTFQLLVQVAGRSGRERSGEVIVQTFSPGHYSLRHALRHDYEGFYQTEIGLRQELNWPPFSRLASLLWETPAKETGETLARALERLPELVSPALEVLGPAEASHHRLKGRWRWQIVFKAPNITTLHQGLKQAQDLIREASPPGPFRIVVDIDPEET
ncbi:primosomal protein N' [Thermosulfuriphilus ammonigenes]|uniref:Replication restart protein PriA n=1 Tax=Thermosulfuriphilus ammonigenes TaxID=1936021 RepID=A0A6G7PVP4_9BACT|nr:primosomal protein N' [Thermosulfuriphilus ammonigenes]MBA2848134.1 primosomal protein N' (replication factor Y) [Thermosulfuriphilus ammonigenes]QIJ71690.1 primosomal protein N' [Thermosulfuriphilus ammonigenes]